MISPKRGTPAALALRLIAEADGDLTAAEVGAHLRPLPRLTSTAGYLAWRAALPAAQRDRDAWASRLVRRLVEAGLVESRGVPVLADWSTRRWDARTASILADWRALGYPVAPPESSARSDALSALLDQDAPRIALVRKVAETPPASVAALVGKSGTAWRAWAWLCDEGVIIPPSRRSVTPKGRALLDRLASSALAPRPPAGGVWSEGDPPSPHPEPDHG